MKENKYQKSPSPKQLYHRFIQRMSHQPTEQQIQRWEDEGGRTPATLDQAYVATLSWVQKIKYYAEKFWKTIHPHTQR
jgi:hypothetical protein